MINGMILNQSIYNENVYNNEDFALKLIRENVDLESKLFTNIILNESEKKNIFVIIKDFIVKQFKKLVDLVKSFFKKHKESSSSDNVTLDTTNLSKDNLQKATEEFNSLDIKMIKSFSLQKLSLSSKLTLFDLVNKNNTNINDDLEIEIRDIINSDFDDMMDNLVEDVFQLKGYSDFNEFIRMDNNDILLSSVNYDFDIIKNSKNDKTFIKYRDNSDSFCKSIEGFKNKFLDYANKWEKANVNSDFSKYMSEYAKLYVTTLTQITTDILQKYSQMENFRIKYNSNVIKKYNNIIAKYK